MKTQTGITLILLGWFSLAGPVAGHPSEEEGFIEEDFTEEEFIENEGGAGAFTYPKPDPGLYRSVDTPIRICGE